MSKTAQERFNRLLMLVQSGAQSGQWEAANKAVAAALQATPKDPNILHLAAQIAESKGEADRAIVFYRRALAAYPNWFEAGMNLARVLSSNRQTPDAVAVLKTLAPHHPQRPEVWEGLARLSQTTNDLPQATEAWRRALALRSDNIEGRGQYHFCLRQLCEWGETLGADANLPPNITAIMFDDPALQKESATRFSARRFGGIAPLPAPPAYNHERLRVGYLSSDFHAHATSWLIAELFSLHDRAKFEVYAYSYGIEDHSAIRERLRREADHFVELNALTAVGCASRIRSDEIDVLIDLKGHTTGGHLDILAYRPAPKQLHWLGFPATTGAAFIDGFIGDKTTIPAGAEAFFTENILRMPHTYQINDRQKTVGTAKAKSDYGLPETALVLASFNQTYKITPDVFAVWCDLLREIPNAVLWLLEANPYAPERLCKVAQEKGLDPARLHFAKPAPQEEHLARYRVVDLALDTFPVGGHTTTSDALWVGAPVVTMAGKSFVSRVAASLLTAAESPQLVTENFEGYKKLALRLAKDKTERDALRAHLTEKRLSLPLFDTPRFVKDFEGLLLKKF